MFVWCSRPAARAFPLEPPQPLRGAGHLGGEHLQGHRPIEADLPRLIDDPHAAAAQLADQLVVAETAQAGPRLVVSVARVALGGRGRPGLEGRVDHGGMLGESAVVLLRGRLLALPPAPLALDPQQLVEQRRTSRLVHAGQEVLDPWPRAPLPVALEAVGLRVDPGPVRRRHLGHGGLRQAAGTSGPGRHGAQGVLSSSDAHRLRIRSSLRSIDRSL